MTSEIVVVATGEGLDTDHIIDGLVWTLHLTIDIGGTSISGFEKYLIIKAYMNELRILDKLTTFVYAEYGSAAAMVT